MKKIFGYLVVFMVLISTSIAFQSCSDDKDDAPTNPSNIVGTWKRTYTQMESGVTSTYTDVMSFNANGTGYEKVDIVASNGASSSYTYPFHYTASLQSNGTFLIMLSYDDEDETYQGTATRTGNTLVIGSTVYELVR